MHKFSFGLVPLLFYLIHGGRALLSPEILLTTVALACVMLVADLVGSLKDIEADPPAASFAQARHQDPVRPPARARGASSGASASATRRADVDGG